VVSTPPPNLHDPRVAAGTLCKARGEAIENLAHYCLVLNDSKCLSARMKAALLAQTDHPIRPAPKFLGFGIRRFNPLVAQQRGHEVAHQGKPVAWSAVEFSSFFEMAHDLSRLLLLRQPAAFDLFSGWETINLHAELQTHIPENFFNLVERFLAEVLGF